MSSPCYRAAVESATISRQTLPAAVVSDAITVEWLGRVPYRDAWALQKKHHAARVSGAIGDGLLLVEHPAVLTLGRHADERHVLAQSADLASRGIEVIRVERGGEVTYHGPGQLVAYPIIGLSRRGLLIRPLVRALEASMVATCAELGVRAGRRDGHPGCWCEPDGPAPRKIGALGIRVERGVTYHGIALNIAPDLADFELIDACGMPGVVSTSVEHELGGIAVASRAGLVERAGRIFADAFLGGLSTAEHG